MGLTKLATRIVDKPWGRVGAGAAFGADSARRVGEVWFEGPPGAPNGVMAKYLFTSERLSIQVHPDDAQASALGEPGGKDECWIVLEAGDDAEIGIGMREPMSAEALLESARDGSIVDKLDWRRPKRRDLIYNPAGTVHALGPGLTVLEIQQSNDVTYRLYDYGRDRPLRLDQAAKVARATPHSHPLDHPIVEDRSAVLVDSGPFAIAWCHRRAPALPPVRDLQLLPIDAAVTAGEDRLLPGECALFDGDPASLRSDGAFVLAWSPQP